MTELLDYKIVPLLRANIDIEQMDGQSSAGSN
jgi:hypothetical protein